MSKKMLIDASHPEETRVAVMQNGKVEDFDFESLSRKPLRGNIYLARITRVEPSLQAAFVEYGGNRHGFLAFNEIHPDYYQIPISDREVLRKAEALEAELAEALSAYETDEDVEPDLDEDDEGLRNVDAEVPDDDEHDQDGDSSEEERRGDRHSEDDQRQAEEEEEEEEPEDGGSPDEKPADYAGEEGAEEPGWHAIEEEEIAALPPRDELPADSKVDNTLSGGPVPAAAKAAMNERSHTTRAEAGTDRDRAPEAESPDNAGDGDEEPEEKTAKPRRRRRGGRGRGRKGTDAEVDGKQKADEDTDDDPGNEAKASNDDNETDGDEGSDKPKRSRRRRGGRGRSKSNVATEDDTPNDGQSGHDDDDDSVDDEPSRSRGKAKNDDPRSKEIAELERRYEEAKRERAKLLRNYRIQEVIKRRQILLVQAVKEERGNKGAALTTYLSLAGRYGVLMPNTARGGGVSRKITNSGDRKRLRAAMSDLKIPQGMGLIIRTAGAKRTKAEIKRDYDYLSRLWETIRDDTMKSVAPCLIYEEASLIKRAIRDLYDKDTDLITVQGDEGYREAKDFMKMLMPSHAKNVQPYKGDVPLFIKHQVERQIDDMYQPTVKLPSGGYLVIQQTEALVSVDVNSGKSTKERNVEQTALKTNLEAAEEVARQCKLRDLAGLVVVDFIDMDERKNNRAVEKKLKDAMKHDRARIQLGYISDFGLLEFSRQRKRSGIVDGTTRLCPLCEGAGHVRSVEMAAMRILRTVEEEAIKGKAGIITVATAMDVALYILNTKRDWLNRIEATYGTSVEVLGDPQKNGDQYGIETRGEPRKVDSLRQAAREELTTLDDDTIEAKSDDDGQDDVGIDGAEDEKPKRRRSRGGRGRNRGSDGSAGNELRAEEDAPTGNQEIAADDDDSSPKTAEASERGDDDDGQPKKRRRRGRRGGRRNKRDGDDSTPEARAEEATAQSDNVGDADGITNEGQSETVTSTESEAVADSYIETTPTDAQPAAPADDDSGAGPDGEVNTAEAKAGDRVPTSEPTEESALEPKPDGPKRGGWWQKALGR